VAAYGALLAVGTAALQWLDLRFLARAHSGSVYLAMVGAAFLLLGLFLGARLFGAPPAPRPPGNPQALAGLGITPRELTVLRELAAGHSNKEIAARLKISPETVKTHAARLLEKLDAKRRTDAIQRARELGLLE